MLNWLKTSESHSHGPRLRGLLSPAIATLALAAFVAIQLHWQGRVWWCSCGRPDLWWGDVHSGHCSQHLLDPYSFTHVSHGLLLFAALTWLFPRLPLPWRFVLALAVEALWEIVENTPFVIERYRTATAALGYEGDSIANSLGDIVCCGIGVVLARFLGLRRSIILFVLIELALLVSIRDNLLLNIVMLFCPINAIKTWQMAGG